MRLPVFFRRAGPRPEVQTPGPKEVLRSVRKIEIRTRKLVDGLMQGHYKSVFMGRGIEFSEVREYVPGDDIRTIDWNVTARMGEPFVKEFIEERDMTVMILFDASASGEFGTQKLKKQQAIELSASLMFSALRNNDRVGLCIFTDRIEKFVPPRKGRRHIMMMLGGMVSFRPEGRGTDIAGPLNYVSKIIRKRSIIFLVSDFMAAGFEKQLKMLRGRHDLVAVSVRDPAEKELPDAGYVYIEDSETGEQVMVNTSDPAFRKSYSEFMTGQANAIGKRFSSAGVDMINAMTDEPFEAPLRKFFRERERRMVR